MPHSRGKKNGKEQKAGRKNVLNMMGYGGDDSDEEDDGMEAELAAILGNDKPKGKKKAPKKLLDWSVIDAQVASSMRDVDEDEDEEVTADDENDFLSELNDLVGEEEEEEEEPSLLKPEFPKRRSPSPQPTSSGSILDVLKDRKAMYDKAIANAQSSGQSSKVRRLQRGVKTLDGLLRSARTGKAVSEDDIPPPVATGQPPVGAASSSEAAPAPPLPQSPSENVKTPVETTVQPAAKVAVPTPLVKVQPTSPAKPSPPQVDPATIKALEDRKCEYRDAALQAKRSGNKEDALKYFKVLKQFDSVLGAAHEGKKVDLSKMPPSPHTSSEEKIEVPPQAVPVQPPTNVVEEPAQSSAGTQPAMPSKPKTVMEALEQRMAKYQASSDEATKEGNGGKARRMGRIVKQYKDAIRSHKAGRAVNFDELPVPPGFPPIPGIKESSQDESLMQKATMLLQQDPEDAPGPSQQSESLQRLAPPAPAPRHASPQRGGGVASGKRSPSPNVGKPSAKGPSTRYDQQVTFLERRQAAFKREALAAKKKGDKAAALEFLRKMKGFDELIEAAKNGLRVDISGVPQPPVESSSGGDDQFEIIERHEISSSRSESNDHLKKNSPEEDDALYSRLLDSLQQQIKKARAYAQQATHSGNVTAAEKSDRLSSSSQVDYDYVRSCRRHGDTPPRFYYEDQLFHTVRMNPDIGSDEMELVIVQCIDLRSGKDSKFFVEWEMPFPHDNQIKGRTDEGRGPQQQSPKFTEATFRVPFNKKLKSNQRAIKNKSIKLEAFHKGGFLRSDKSIGVALIKLNPLESQCEMHAVEELKEGRNVVGKIEAYVKLRTPLLASESQTTKERWVSVVHAKRPRTVEPPPQPSTKPHGAPTPSSRGAAKVNIASIPVLELELKVTNARIEECKRKGASSKDHQREAASIQQKINTTKKFLRDGGSQALSEYVACLTRHFQHLNEEAQAYGKQGKRDQAKLALAKKSLVKTELEKYKSRKT